MRAIRAVVVLLLAGVGGLWMTVSAAAAPSSQDGTWMVAAHQNNLAEIAAGHAAEQKASTQGVKDLGAMFVQMHTALDADLTKAATQLGVSLPGAPTPAQQSSLAAVTAKSGQAFDTAWVAQQIAGHRDAAAATQQEIANGSNATVVNLAKAALPVIQSHLSELQKVSGASPTGVQAGSGGQAASTPAMSTPVIALAVLGFALLIASGGWSLARRRR